MDLFQSKAGTSAGFEPIALQGTYVAIHYFSETLYKQVDFWEPIPPFQCIDLGTVPSVTSLPRTNLTNLEAWDDEFCQYRIWTLDNVQLRIFEPGAVGRAFLRNIQSQPSSKMAFRNQGLNLAELCVWEDNRPAVEAVNGTGYTLYAVRILAMGFRYHVLPVSTPLISALSNNSLACTHVWCTAKGT